MRSNGKLTEKERDKIWEVIDITCTGVLCVNCPFTIKIGYKNRICLKHILEGVLETDEGTEDQKGV